MKRKLSEFWDDHDEAIINGIIFSVILIVAFLVASHIANLCIAQPTTEITDYGVVAKPIQFQKDTTIFEDFNGTLWAVEDKDREFDLEGEYIILINHNGTAEPTDDEIIDIVPTDY